MKETIYSSHAVYPYIRRILFIFDAEKTHHFTLLLLRLFIRGPILKLLQRYYPVSPVTVMGLRFPNPVGISAGLDQHGECFNALSALGFGFVEIGGLTPKPQTGNPKPRLFRLPQAYALINRKGFANKGIHYALPYLKERKGQAVLGVNISKNKDTSNENAVDDYLYCMQEVYPFADYVSVNVSSPNTPGLRQLQTPAYLHELLTQLKAKQSQLQQQYQRYVPLVVKISPDVTIDDISEIAKILLETKIDGVAATNTTVTRPDVDNLLHANEAGGLSGKPLFAMSTAVVQQLQHHLQGKIPIIAGGGILSGADAQEKMRSGASLVQIYTGFIYHGPALIREIIHTLNS